MNTTTLWEWLKALPFGTGAPRAARIVFAAALAAGIAVWIAASIRYVMVCVLGLYAFLQTLFALPPVTTMAWFVLGTATWLIALPLIRRHYES